MSDQENLPFQKPGDAYALLVIDIQKGLFEKSIPIFHAEELLQNIRTLVEKAHAAGAPVFYIQHSSEKVLPYGSEEWKLHPGLQPLKFDCIIQKYHGNAFEDTGLDNELASRNVGRLVITGLVTHGCVKATCLGAHQAGYQVILVKDGHSNYHKQAQKMIEEWNEKLSQGIVELKSAIEIDFQKKS